MGRLVCFLRGVSLLALRAANGGLRKIHGNESCRGAPRASERDDDLWHWGPNLATNAVVFASRDRPKRALQKKMRRDSRSCVHFAHWITRDHVTTEIAADILVSMTSLPTWACSLIVLLSTASCAGADGSEGANVEGNLGQDACASDKCVDSFPFQETVDRASFPRNTIQRYGCGDARARTHAARERVYEVDLESDGLFAAQVPAGFDVYIGSSRDFSSCLRGSAGQTAVWLSAGHYVVSVDSRSGSAVPRGVVKLAHTTARTLSAAGMDEGVAKRGLQAFSVAAGKGETKKLLYAMADFAVPSDKKRQWVVDLSTSQIKWNLYVAHGERTSSPTDKRVAQFFANVGESRKTSLGMMRSAETYSGDFGYSYRLEGLEPGYNDKVRSRSVVVHPWFGSSPRAVELNRATAPTWGCPAVDQDLPREYFDTLANGVLHWYSAQDGDWSEHTRYALPE